MPYVDSFRNRRIAKLLNIVKDCGVNDDYE